MNDMDENTKNNEFINHLGLEMIEESSKYAKGRIPVKAELLNPFGTMHGGGIREQMRYALGFS